MPEKESPYKISPPAKKELKTDPLKKEISKPEEPREDIQKKASELVKKADLSLPYEETYAATLEARERLAREKEKAEKGKEVLSKKEKLRNQLVEKGLKDEALLAFESAYNPKISPKIKQILTDKKLDIRKPQTWDTVHKLLTTPAKDKPYFCEAYVDEYKNFIPLVPLVSPEEKPVYVADFEKMDLEGENIIKGDAGETVAEGPEKRKMEFNKQVLAVENPVKSVDDVYAYVEKLPSELQDDVAVMLDESDLKNMNLFKLRQVAQYINGIAEGKDKKEPLRKLRVALGREALSEKDVRMAEKVEGKGILGIDKKDLPQNVFGEEKPQVSGISTRKPR
ncbi:hypothetical protein KKA33_04315 [Patescibacteria group bacterium]|nr:hypothetical protein [Patescibacteria group bacterium]